MVDGALHVVIVLGTYSLEMVLSMLPYSSSWPRDDITRTTDVLVQEQLMNPMAYAYSTQPELHHR